MKSSVFLHALLLLMMGVPFFLSAESGLGTWTNWRGPNYNGSQGQEGALPEKFGPDEGVRWKCSLPGSSAATPIIDSSRVFLSSVKMSSDADEKQGDLVALCLDRFTGKILWQRKAGSGYLPGGDGFSHQLDSKSNYASPSPVTDGERVIFFFGNGDLVAYSLKGEEEWRRNVQRDFGDFCFQWTFSSSPTLHRNRLYLPVLQRDEPVHGRGKPNAESFLLCMDPKNGKTLWKKTRASSARKESLESFGTIIPHEGQLLVAGGDVLTGHDPKTGNELWRWGTWNPGHKQEWWRLVPSPVVGGGRILVCAPKKAPVYAIEAGLSGSHSGEDGLAWSTEDQPILTSDVPTPLYYRDKFFVLSDLRKVLSRVNPKNGKLEWSLDLPGKYKWRSSPTGGDGKIYMMNHNGEVLVVSSESGKILTHAKMGDSYDDNTRSSVALAGNNLFIRTNKILYCIE
ncbi:MAG: PQQ-binding-like beta-propeller repeat protein [Verrucomicrobiota bacterium]|nr:PQQ-binding-like beta-propeller repeat protein [Verrucomicrobiota bacterium]